jgi:hypothetical protein
LASSAADFDAFFLKPGSHFCAPVVKGQALADAITKGREVVTSVL